MFYQGKLKQSQLRNTSSTSYFAQPRNISYRTLLKRRNDTITSSQLYEDQSFSKENGMSRSLSPSQTLSQKRNEYTRPSLAIKDYVKKMGNKREHQKASLKMQKIEVVKQEDDRRSQKSSRSAISSSQALKKEVVLSVKEEKRTLQQLQRRVEILIGQTLNQLKRPKLTTEISHSIKTEPNQPQSQEKQMEDLCAWIRELSEKEEGPIERLDDLNRKMILIQKLLAREEIESELLQAIYFNWKIQRSNTASYGNKDILRDSKKYNQPWKDQKQHKQTIQSRQIVSNYGSTNSASFKRPPKQYYVASKDKKNSYSVNRQPLPRSSYSAQYFNYGHISTYSHKPNETRQYPETSLAVKSSTYRQEYKPKLSLTRNTDFKELDCYKDKFQNTNISFIQSSKKESAGILGLKKPVNGRLQESKENINAAGIKRSQESLLGCMSMSCSNLFKSEHQKQYYWHNDMNTEEGQKDAPLKSEMKDQRLLRLKESFRALAMKR